MSAYKDPGRLLLLRGRAAGALLGPRQERRGDGPGYDRRYNVSQYPQNYHVVLDYGMYHIFCYMKTVKFLNGFFSIVKKLTNERS